MLVASHADAPVLPDVLINLGAPTPAWHDRCTRIAEVVGADPERKDLGRRKYRAYREAGHELRTHEV